MYALVLCLVIAEPPAADGELSLRRPRSAESPPPLAPESIPGAETRPDVLAAHPGAIPFEVTGYLHTTTDKTVLIGVEVRPEELAELEKLYPTVKSAEQIASKTLYDGWFFRTYELESSAVRDHARHVGKQVQVRLVRTFQHQPVVLQVRTVGELASEDRNRFHVRFRDKRPVRH